MTDPLCIICAGTLGYVGISTTTCGHLYHADCLQTWRHRARSCPQCRKPICDVGNVIRKLYFTVDDSAESECDDKKYRSENYEEIKRLQEQLSTERQNGDDLSTNLREERKAHQISRVHCLQLKEDYYSSKKKALDEVSALQKEIKEIRTAVKLYKLDGMSWKSLGMANKVLDNLKTSEAKNSHYFIQRIWHLMIEIKNRKAYVKELETSILKLSRETEDQNFARVEKNQIEIALKLVENEMKTCRVELEKKEKEVENLSTRNASLTILVAFEKERSRQTRHVAEPSSLREDGLLATHCNLTASFERCRQLVTRWLSIPINEVCLDFVSLTNIVENYDVEKTFVYITMSVLSYYMSTWLDVHPGLMLAVTGMMTAIVKSND